MLSKGKGIIIGKHWEISLIEVDLEYMMRINLHNNEEEMIEKIKIFKSKS